MFLPSARRADIGARYSIQNFALSVAVGSGVAFLRYGRTSSFSNGPKQTCSPDVNAASQLAKPAVPRVREIRSPCEAPYRADYGTALIVAALGSRYLLPQNIQLTWLRCAS
jgi:hypothetical protein